MIPLASELVLPKPFEKFDTDSRIEFILFDELINELRCFCIDIRPCLH